MSISSNLDVKSHKGAHRFQKHKQMMTAATAAELSAPCPANLTRTSREIPSADSKSNASEEATLMRTMS